MTSNTYIIYSISNSPYQEWQADLLDYSFTKVKQPGTLIRLCSEDAKYPKRKIPLSKAGLTICTPNFSRLTPETDWPVMNKPGSLKVLFKKKIFHDEDTLIFLDPDMIFVKIWAPEVKMGSAYGQKWKGYKNNYCQKTSIQPELCPANEDACLMYPFAITAGDMKNIVENIEYFSRKGYLKCHDWMADMSAFVIAMVKHKIRMETRDNIGLCNNWDNKNDDAAPIMHYCQQMKNACGKKLWGKWRYQPWKLPPDPSRATNQVDREVLTMLRTFIESMKQGAI
ncbi:MAG: hypothetical protein GY801_11875 [bacterium]|nr:hypothetical protein [bacterium]